MKRKYHEMFKLKKMLEDAKIPFEWKENWGYDGAHLQELRHIAPDLVERYQICYPKFNEPDRMLSAIQGFGTYGAEQDLIEIMGLLTFEEKSHDCVVGYLTAQNVFDRIKKHYERRIIMGKTIKVIDEDTLEMKEVTIEEDITEEDDKNKVIRQTLQKALECGSEEFYQKYKAYKEAEAEFNAIYEPFKKNLIKLHQERTDLPNTVIIGGTKLIYVSPSIRSSIDSKKLKEEEPEIAEKFTKNTEVKANIRLEEV